MENYDYSLSEPSVSNSKAAWFAWLAVTELHGLQLHHVYKNAHTVYFEIPVSNPQFGSKSFGFSPKVPQRHLHVRQYHSITITFYHIMYRLGSNFQVHELLNRHKIIQS